MKHTLSSDYIPLTGRQQAVLMGKVVRVSYVVNDKGESRDSCTTPWLGWVTGFTHRRSGFTDKEYRCWVNQGPSLQVALVRPWPWVLPLDVLVSDLVVMPVGTLVKFNSVSDREKELMSEEAKKAPRDAKGRFILRT